MKAPESLTRIIIRYLIIAGLALLVAPAHADVEIGGEAYRVVDMHLHPGGFGRFPASGRQFVIESLPPFVRPYAPALGNVINALAEQVDADGTDQTVCAGLPGGDLMLTQNVSAEAEQPETATAPDDAGQEAG